MSGLSVTDEIKARIDLVSYVQRHVPGLKKAGRNHKACCPFHDERTPSFVVNPARGSWYCFGACAEGGDLFSFAQKFHGWDFREALRELAAEAGVELRPQTPAQRQRSDRLEHLRSLLASAAEQYQRALQAAGGAALRDYLQRQRGISGETVKDFQLGYAPDSWDFMLRALRAIGYADDDIIAAGIAARSESGRVYDRFRNRLMIPIQDERGRVVAFGGRALDAADNAKYINSPQSEVFDKSRLLFGLHRARRAIREQEQAVIVEGYMDVIQAHQAGYTNVVAQMGTTMTEHQLRLLAPRLAERIVLALDADPAGQNATRRSLDVARATLARDFGGKQAVDIRVLQIPAGKDPDDFLRERADEWDALVAKARSIADFVIDLETMELPPDASLPQRRAIAHNLLPLLLAAEDDLFRQENVQKLARRLRMGERDLLALLPPQLPNYLTKKSLTPQLDQPAPDLPPEYWDNEYGQAPPDAEEMAPAPAVMAGRKPRQRDSAKPIAEAYCLRLFLQNPSLLPRVNRILRELAGRDEALMAGPLGDIGGEDFSESAFRILMAQLQASLNQHEKEPLEFIKSSIDSSLEAELGFLLVDDLEALAVSVQNRFEVDLNDIVKRRHYRARLVFSIEDDLLQRALQLRLARLDNERMELQYLQEEAQDGTETDEEHLQRINRSIMLSLQAKAKIDRALGLMAKPAQPTMTL